jgi:TolB-like protein/tetratricopeptide (TPR) repeat protein
MIRGDGLVKVLDFGLARSVSPGTAARTATMPGTIMGTAPYMSPEQVLGQPAGPPSDLFSLGTIAYELLTGRHPFAADTPIETMHKILHETPAPPSRVNQSLTADFDFVLAKVLSKDPTRRHASARDLDVDLETLESSCGPAVTPKSSAAAGPRAMAVLPFKNIGGDPELGYLGVGLADAVITRLSSSPDLIVRATSSIAPYQNQAVDPRRVGVELDVSAVLDASFQKIGDRFRATARLIETSTGRSLWAGKVDLKFEDIFEVQDQVAHGIAEGMTARLEESTGSKPKPRYTPSSEAYDKLMRGQDAFREANIDGFLRAVQLFEEAVRLDPEYGEAWAHFGATCHAMVDSGFDPDPSWLSKADHALARARELDPLNPMARFATAAFRLTRGAKRDAYESLTEAMVLAPNHSMIYHYFAYLFRLCDMLEEGAAASRRAQELNPSSPWAFWMEMRIRALRGDTQGAREILQSLQARLGRGADVQRADIMLLGFEERLEEVANLVEKAGTGPTSTVNFEAALAWIRLGHPERAAESIAICERFAAVDMDSAAHAASLHSYLGNMDAAFRHLDRATALGNDTLTYYQNPTFFGPLFSDPRWPPFLEGVRTRVAQWKREFLWPPKAVAAARSR